MVQFFKASDKTATCCNWQKIFNLQQDLCCKKGSGWSLCTYVPVVETEEIPRKMDLPVCPAQKKERLKTGYILSFSQKIAQKWHFCPMGIYVLYGTVYPGK
jgi:hypothetical protein